MRFKETLKIGKNEALDENSETFVPLCDDLFEKVLRMALNRVGAQSQSWLLSWVKGFGPCVTGEKKACCFPLKNFISALLGLPEGSGDEGLLTALMRIEPFPNSCSVFSGEAERAHRWKEPTYYEVAMNLASILLWKELIRTRGAFQYWMLTWHDGLGICIQREKDQPGIAYSFMDTLESFSHIPDGSGQCPALSPDSNILCESGM